MTEQDHYAVLDLPQTASDADIKRRYRRLMREVHPDANGGDARATRQAARINRAYETLGNPERRRAYDLSRAGTRPRAAIVRDAARDRKYAAWAVEPDWEDIVAEHVPPKRAAHRHAPPPRLDPEEIEVHLDELRAQARVRRTVTVTNECDCSLVCEVSTSEAWLWGPIGEFVVPARAAASFEIEVVARKVAFPGISRVVVVARDWTGTVPVRVTGYAPKRRRMPPAADMPYVRGHGGRGRWSRSR
ncbi:MAG TPA: DnaJ domain-containing protein [Dehalococcoidia bacterium]|nr:DnaJ domain-containing protein [Dehalococcoidia bacterium]